MRVVESESRRTSCESGKRVCIASYRSEREELGFGNGNGIIAEIGNVQRGAVLAHLRF